MSHASPAAAFAHAEELFEREFKDIPSMLNDPAMRLVFIRAYMAEQV